MVINFTGACYPLYIWVRAMSIQVFHPFFNWTACLLCSWVASGVGLVILKPEHDLALANRSSACGLSLEGVQRVIFCEQLWLSCAFSLKRSPEPASFSYHVSLFCSLPLYMVGRSDIKQGWLNKGWYIDIKNALTEIPLCSLGQRSVIVTGVALVTSVAWKPLMGTQVTHDSGWVQEVRKKEGLRERGKKRKKVKQDFIVWMKDQELGN